jgi:hypothetical protein
MIAVERGTMHRRDGKRRIRSRGLARMGLALLAGACSPALDPLSERCLQALEYREPAHGDIEITESYPSPSGTTVAIRYVEEDDSGSELPQTFTCEFGAGGPWSFIRITLLGRELSEAELALVNAEFLLRDLGRHPERLSDRRAAGGTPARLEVAAGPERDDPPPGSRFSWAPSWIENVLPAERYQ